MKKLLIKLVLFLIGVSFGVLTLYEYLSNIPSNKVPQPILRGWYTEEELAHLNLIKQEWIYFFITVLFLISAGVVDYFTENRGRFR